MNPGLRPINDPNLKGLSLWEISSLLFEAGWDEIDRRAARVYQTLATLATTNLLREVNHG